MLHIFLWIFELKRSEPCPFSRDERPAKSQLRGAVGGLGRKPSSRGKPCHLAEKQRVPCCSPNSKTCELGSLAHELGITVGDNTWVYFNRLRFWPNLKQKLRPGTGRTTSRGKGFLHKDEGTLKKHALRNMEELQAGQSVFVVFYRPQIWGWLSRSKVWKRIWCKQWLRCVAVWQNGHDSKSITDSQSSYHRLLQWSSCDDPASFSHFERKVSQWPVQWPSRYFSKLKHHHFLQNQVFCSFRMARPTFQPSTKPNLTDSSVASNSSGSFASEVRTGRLCRPVCTPTRVLW